ncbi:MAG: glucuronate isomerase, partial [Gemmataceae bacterium]
VKFPISVLTSGQNQELVAYAWIFPNVIPHGHWWYSNIPAYITPDLRERLQGVPSTKLIGYYSDAYKLEFVLPKFGMYRRILAGLLATEFVEPGFLTETQAIELGELILRGNVRSVFNI